MSGEEMTVGSLTALLAGGVVKVEIVQDLNTDERLLALSVETEAGVSAEVTVEVDAAVEIATDLLMLAQQCRTHNEGGPQ